MIKINNIEKFPELPFDFTLDATEEFKKGIFRLDNLTQITPFDDYSEVVVTINEVDYKFTLESDLPNRVSNGINTHPITMLEEVVKFNDVQIPDRAFSTTQGEQTTWKYQLETILITHNLQYTVDSETLALLNVTANNQQYSGSFLNFLIIAFRAVDAVPTLDGTVIGHNLLNENREDISTKVQAIFDADKVESRRYEANINDYASSVYSKLKNASNELDEIGVSWFPSKTGYVTVRSNDNKYKDDGAEIQFNGNERKLENVYIQFEIFIVDNDIGSFGSTGDVPATAVSGDRYTCDTNGYVSTNAGLTFDIGDTATWIYNKWYKNFDGLTSITLDIDITDYVNVKEAWDKLIIATNQSTVVTGIYQNNSLWFNDGGDTLQNIGTQWDLSFLPSNEKTTFTLLKLTLETRYNFTIGSTNSSLRNARYKFKTRPSRDYDTDVERHTSDRVKIKSVKTNQQQESRVEISKQGKANYQYVNRLGNERFEITLQYFKDNPYNLDKLTYDDIWNLFDYYNGFKIVKMKITINTNMMEVTYLFVKNQSNLNPNSAFTSPVSPFTIQDKIQAKTCYVRKHYVVFGDILMDNTLNSRTKAILWNRFNYTVGNDKPIYNAVYTSADADEDISLEVQRSIEGRGFTYNVQFNSKTIAGSKIEPDTALAHKLTPINYTNQYGEVEDCVIHYCNEVNVTPEDYPIADSYTSIFGNYTRTIKKQPNEILGETTRIECISDRENLFVYESYLKNNSIIREIDEDITLRVYYYSKASFTTDTKVLPSGAFTSELVTVSNYKLTLSGTYLGFNYAIVDNATNELYFAYNNYGEDLLEINMSLRVENPNLGGI